MNLNFHCSFSFMAVFIIWPLYIKEINVYWISNKYMNETFLLKTLVTFLVPSFLCHMPYYQTRKLLNLGRQNLPQMQNKIWAKIHYKISYVKWLWLRNTEVILRLTVLHYQLVHQLSFQLTFLEKNDFSTIRHAKVPTQHKPFPLFLADIFAPFLKWRWHYWWTWKPFIVIHWNL